MVGRLLRALKAVGDAVFVIVHRVGAARGAGQVHQAALVEHHVRNVLVGKRGDVLLERPQVDAKFGYPVVDVEVTAQDIGDGRVVVVLAHRVCVPRDRNDGHMVPEEATTGAIRPSRP